MKSTPLHHTNNLSNYCMLTILKGEDDVDDDGAFLS
jgi:hypothetical protein